MMAKFQVLAVCLLAALLAVGIAAGQDGQPRVPYVQTGGFNAPVIEGWENQSTDEVAQFHLADAKATIRTAIVPASEPVAAAGEALGAWLGVEIGDAVYSGKVNLADGTWHSLVYELDATSTASVMARRVGEGSVVISFVERDESNRIIMLTMAQAGETRDLAISELKAATDLLLAPLMGQQGTATELSLPSGTWMLYPGAGHTRMGMTFGNDSFLSLAVGPIGVYLSELADAYNRTLLGFFITPDNSLYLGLGLAATFFILGVLVLSWLWRARSMMKDLLALKALADGDDG